jgi:iron complex transport system ATP-binding protein
MPIAPADSALTTHDLRVGYAGAEVARLGDAVLRPGTLTALLGRNGAGKTTVLKTVAGLLRPVGGSVQVGGDDLFALAARERARRLSLVLADRTTAGGLTARDVVTLGRYPHTPLTGRLSQDDRLAVDQALAASGADAYAERPIGELSSGEQQRVFIARALAQDGAVVLLDEPTAHLDAPGRTRVFELLRELAHTQRRALLVATHELDAALASADRVWVLVPHGTSARLVAGVGEELGARGVLSAAFGAPVGYRPETQRSDASIVTVEAEGADRFWAEHLARRLGYRVGLGGVPVERVGEAWRVAGEPAADLEAVADLLRPGQAG